jgi:hypothetical protein
MSWFVELSLKYSYLYINVCRTATEKVAMVMHPSLQNILKNICGCISCFAELSPKKVAMLKYIGL